MFAASALFLVLTALYGVGTTLHLSGWPVGPRSSAVAEIQQEATGWREVGPVLAEIESPVFALDYSIASQAWYYSGRPVYTSWGQYRIWGIPSLNDVAIVGLTYLPEDLVTARLRETFAYVEGPQSLRFGQGNATREVRLWKAKALLVEQETFLERFDFLRLQRDSR